MIDRYRYQCNNCGVLFNQMKELKVSLIGNPEALDGDWNVIINSIKDEDGNPMSLVQKKIKCSECGSTNIIDLQPDEAVDPGEDYIKDLGVTIPEEK